VYVCVREREREMRSVVVSVIRGVAKKWAGQNHTNIHTCVFVCFYY